MRDVHGWRNKTAISLDASRAYVALHQEPGARRHEDAALDPDGCQFGLRPMSSMTAKSQFAFELPNLTYIDASLEEANFRAPVLPSKPHGLSAWVAAFRGWHEKQVAINELEMMSDRELADIGLNRCDVHRVFDQDYNQDLRDRAMA
jgi:uncharacterized protein YjiS (DUF1127 family)